MKQRLFQELLHAAHQVYSSTGRTTAVCAMAFGPFICRQASTTSSSDSTDQEMV